MTKTREDIEKIIDFKKNKLNKSKDNVERAILSGEINRLREELSAIDIEEPVKDITIQIDAPPIADKECKYDTAAQTMVKVNSSTPMRILI